MSKFGLSVDDVRHVPMYEEYLSLRRDGVPKERIWQHLVEKADRDRWYTAFGSDVAANVLTTAGFWLLGKLINK